MIQQIAPATRADVAMAAERGARRGDEVAFRLPEGESPEVASEQAAQRRAAEPSREREKAEEEQAVVRSASLEVALRAARAEASARREKGESEQAVERAEIEALTPPAALIAGPVGAVQTEEPLVPLAEGERAARRPSVHGPTGRREDVGGDGAAPAKGRLDAARRAAARPDGAKTAQAAPAVNGEEPESRVQIDGSAKLGAAARVEHALRGAHRQVAAVGGGTVGAIAEAVRKALKALAEGEPGNVGALDELLESTQAADGAAFSALLARSEGAAQGSLVAARAATTMPMPTGASAEGGLPTFELGGDLGMIVRMRSEDGGDIEVRVQLDGRSVQVRVRAEEAAARARLLESLPALRRELERLPEIAMHGARVDVQEDTRDRSRQGGARREQTGDDVAEEAPELAELREALGQGSQRS